VTDEVLVVGVRLGLGRPLFDSMPVARAAPRRYISVPLAAVSVGTCNDRSGPPPLVDMCAERQACADLRRAPDSGHGCPRPAPRFAHRNRPSVMRDMPADSSSAWAPSSVSCAKSRWTTPSSTSGCPTCWSSPGRPFATATTSSGGRRCSSRGRQGRSSAARRPRRGQPRRPDTDHRTERLPPEPRVHRPDGVSISRFRTSSESNASCVSTATDGALPRLPQPTRPDSAATRSSIESSAMNRPHCAPLPPTKPEHTPHQWAGDLGDCPVRCVTGRDGFMGLSGGGSSRLKPSGRGGRRSGDLEPDGLARWGWHDRPSVCE
jgi:hypothetical protein